MQVLFVGGQPACLSSGFTAHMLSVLERPIGIPEGKQVRFITKPSAAIVQRCLGRMVNWVIVAESTLKAEFHAFETVQAFGALNVVRRRDRDDAANRDRRVQLETLAAAFGIVQPLDILQKQLSGLQHIAERVATEEHVSSHDAWHKAISIVKRARDRGPSTCDALLEVLVRLWASGASTSGVEQSFSAVSRSAGTCLDALTPSHLNDRMEVLDLAQADEASVIKTAQKHWSAFYGPQRVSGEGRRPSRRDAGRVKEKSQQKVSERSFREKRKAAVDAAVDAAMVDGRPVLPIATRSLEVWDDAQDKELEFADRKRIVRLAEEFGSLGQDVSNLSLDDLQAVVEELDRKKKRDQRYVAIAAKRRKFQQGPERKSLSGATIYMDRDIVVEQLPDYALVCKRDNLHVTLDATQATVFVVIDIDQPKPVHCWNSALAGGVMCEWEAVRSGQGPVLQFHPALRTRRSLWMSDEFLSTNHQVARTILDRMQTFRFRGRRSQWHIFADEAAFRARSLANPSEAVALIGPEEAADWAGVKQAFTVRAALDFFRRMDEGASFIVGGCQR